MQAQIAAAYDLKAPVAIFSLSVDTSLFLILLTHCLILKGGCGQRRQNTGTLPETEISSSIWPQHQWTGSVAVSAAAATF